MIERTVSLADIDIHYVEDGDSGPPVVLLHGITDSLESYLPVLPHLVATARVFALDFRGHGDSSRGPTPYRLDSYTRDIEGFLNQVVQEPALVAGHSLGGLVAAQLAARSKVELLGLLLEDPPFYKGQMPVFKETMFYPAFVATQKLLRDHHASGRTIDELARVVGDLPHDPSGHGPSMLEVLGEDMVQIRASTLHRFDPDALDAAVQGTVLGGFDPDVELASIPCSTHLIAGNYELGGALDRADVERVTERIPRSTHVVWDDIGHLIHSERPEAFARELLSLLSAVSAAKQSRS